MLADSAAVAVFHLTVHGGCPLGAGTGRQLRRFFKGQLLLHTPQSAARLVALIIHGTAQIPLRRPAPVRHRVLQDDRHDPAFYDLEHGGLIVGDEDFGFHRQLQPGFPAPGVGGHGVLEHLEFHIRYLPFSGSINLLCIYMVAGAKKYPRRPKRSSGGISLGIAAQFQVPSGGNCKGLPLYLERHTQQPSQRLGAADHNNIHGAHLTFGFAPYYAGSGCRVTRRRGSAPPARSPPCRKAALCPAQIHC